MTNATHHKKRTLIFVILGTFFISNVLLAEFIGTKIFSLERTIGMEPVSWQLFGSGKFSFNLTAGVLIWPVVFIMTDIINEYFGRKGVRTITFIAAGLLIYAFTIVIIAIHLVPADSWAIREVAGQVFDMNRAFIQIFGLGLWIIGGSLVAFLLSQLIDAVSFHWIKSRTGERGIWLRATGSTLISQLFDSFVVLFIAFYWGANMKLNEVIALSTMNYIYKVSLAILLIPMLYIIHYLIDRYLGEESAKQLRKEAMEVDQNIVNN